MYKEYIIRRGVVDVATLLEEADECVHYRINRDTLLLFAIDDNGYRTLIFTKRGLLKTHESTKEIIHSLERDACLDYEYLKHLYELFVGKHYHEPFLIVDYVLLPLREWQGSWLAYHYCEEMTIKAHETLYVMPNHLIVSETIGKRAQKQYIHHVATLQAAQTSVLQRIHYIEQQYYLWTKSYAMPMPFSLEQLLDYAVHEQKITVLKEVVDQLGLDIDDFIK